MPNDSTALAQAENEFRVKYPAFETTRKLDELRAWEYARLDQQRHIYLNYTGGGLYADSQLRAHMELLSQHVFGNPHSTNPTSMAMTQLIDQARAYVLEYFNASAQKYVVVFTQNASGALKLVGESYPFESTGQYLCCSTITIRLMASVNLPARKTPR